MDILKVLAKLGQLEHEASKLYNWFAALYAYDEKARSFFRKLSVEEQTHFDLVKYQERIVRSAPKDFAGVDIDTQAIDRILSRMAEFQTVKPTLKDAIRFALDIETEIVESYAVTVMDTSNKELPALMKSLTANAKEDHCKELFRFAASYD